MSCEAGVSVGVHEREIGYRIKLNTQYPLNNDQPMFISGRNGSIYPRSPFLSLLLS